jgi:hypothetical protein
LLLFPLVAERVHVRYSGEYVVGNFEEVLRPLASKIKKTTLSNPGSSPAALFKTFENAMDTGFTLGASRLA